MTTDIWNGNGNWTANPTDWSTGSSPPSSDDAEIASGTDTLTTTTSVHSVTIAPAANLNLTGAASLTTTANLTNLGALGFDVNGNDGGAKVTVGGTLVNFGSITVGNSALTAAATLAAAALADRGSLTIQGNAASKTTLQATVAITAAAPTTLSATDIVRGDGDLKFGSGAITQVAYGGALELDGAQARVSIGSGTTNSALTTLASNYGTLTMRGGTSYGAGGSSVTTSVGFTNSGVVNVDVNGGEGGSSLTLGGVLANSGVFNVGNNGLSAATTVAASGLVNSDQLTLQGNGASGPTNRATLNIGGAAPASLTANTFVRGDADLVFKSGAITSIGAGALLEIDGAQARISIGAGTTSSALATLTAVYGTLYLRGDTSYGAGGSSVKTTVGLTNDNVVSVDVYGGEGGSTLAIGGAITNRRYLTIGNNDLSAATMVTAAALANSGTLTLQGNEASGATNQATLNIGAAAPASLTAITQVRGDADLQFKSGAITSIGVNGELEIDGAQARVSVGAGTTNSALTTLTANYGILYLRGGTSYGAGGTSVTTKVGLTNFFGMDIDFNGGEGGSSLAIGGQFVNRGLVNIGNNGLSAATTVTAAALANSGTLTLQGNEASGATSQATLNIGGAAPASLTGSTYVRGDADLEFKSGPITSIGGGAVLEIDGAQARVSLGAATTNTALTALAANYGTLSLRGGTSYGAGGSSIKTTSGFTNDGVVNIDINGGEGGSSLTVGGLLINAGLSPAALDIGNNGLSAATTVTAAGLLSSGFLTLQGNESSGVTNQATLNIGAAAPTMLTSVNYVRGDADLEFKSGAITSIGAICVLEIDGAQARISIGAGTTNSALTTLAANYGTLDLRGDTSYGLGGSSIQTTIGFTNQNLVEIDTNGGEGGSSLTIGGVLNNADAFSIGNNGLSGATTVIATGLINTGFINLEGNEASGATNQTTLNIGGAAAAALTASTQVRGDADLEFKSGAITSIGAGASLELDGAQARISIGAGTTNSALTTLASNYGFLTLQGGTSSGAGGASIATKVGFTNDGAVSIDFSGGDGGSSVTLGGVLTNAGSFNIGNTGLGAATFVSATALVNDGALSVTSGAQLALLEISGAATNAGSLTLGGSAQLDVNGAAYIQTAGTTTVAGLLSATTIEAQGGLIDFTAALTKGDGTGALQIYAAGAMEFAAAVDASHTVTFKASSGVLDLAAPASFGGTIAGFGGADVIDLVATTVTGLSFASGILSVTVSGGPVDKLAFSGAYTTASFTTVSDGNGGTDILDPPRQAPLPVAGLHGFTQAAAGLGGGHGGPMMSAPAGWEPGRLLTVPASARHPALQ